MRWCGRHWIAHRAGLAAARRTADSADVQLACDEDAAPTCALRADADGDGGQLSDATASDTGDRDATSTMLSDAHPPGTTASEAASEREDEPASGAETDAPAEAEEPVVHAWSFGISQHHLPSSLWRRAMFDAEVVAHLRDLLAVALADRRISLDALVAAAPRDPYDPDLPDLSCVASLRAMVGDLGIVVDEDDPPRGVFCLASAADGLPDELHETAAEGVEFVRHLCARQSDLVAYYVASVPRGHFSRQANDALAAVIQRSAKATLVGMAWSPAAVAALRETMEELLAGTKSTWTYLSRRPSPRGQTPTDLDGADDDDDDDGAEAASAGGGPLLARPGAPVAATGSASSSGRLGLATVAPCVAAVRDACDALAAGADEVLAQRFGAAVSELGVSDRLLAQLEAIVEQDPAGAEARQRIAPCTAAMRRATDQFARGNLRLAIWAAARSGGIEWLDRVQAANIALLKAIRHYDPERNATFGTYATWVLRQSVRKAIVQQSRFIRLDLNLYDVLRKVGDERHAGQLRTGREPTIEELAERTDLTSAQVATLLIVEEEPASLTDSEVWQEAIELASTDPTGEELVAAAEAAARIRLQVHALPERLSRIISLRYGLDGGMAHTLEEIGELYCLTRERIRQLELKALALLSKPDVLRELRACR